MEPAVVPISQGDLHALVHISYSLKSKGKFCKNQTKPNEIEGGLHLVQ